MPDESIDNSPSDVRRDLRALARPRHVRELQNAVAFLPSVVAAVRPAGEREQPTSGRCSPTPRQRLAACCGTTGQTGRTIRFHRQINNGFSQLEFLGARDRRRGPTPCTPLRDDHVRDSQSRRTCAAIGPPSASPGDDGPVIGRRRGGGGGGGPAGWVTEARTHGGGPARARARARGRTANFGKEKAFSRGAGAGAAVGVARPLEPCRLRALRGRSVR